MSIKKEIIKIEDLQKGYLTFPVDEDQFKDFITGLLGTPQTITKTIRGTFEIHLKDLQNFHDLIEQRVSQQNNGKLLQLKTQIYFSDNSSVLLGSYSELITYNEIKSVYVMAIRMTWVYLIKFQDKTVPEKQEVELYLNNKADIESLIENDLSFPSLFAEVLGDGQRNGLFKIIIRHTARSWGTDIESIFTNQIESILIKDNTWKDFVRKKRFYFSFFSIVLLTVCISFITNQIEIKNSAHILLNANSIIKNLGTNVNIKLDSLIKYVLFDTAKVSRIDLDNTRTVCMLFSILIGVLIYYLANNQAQSFILLTRESINRKRIYDKRRSRKALWFIISFLTSIISGIIGCFIYQWLIGS